MSSPANPPANAQPLDLSKWRGAPTMLMAGGAGVIVLGFLVDQFLFHADALTQFAYSWLLAFMFFLSLGLGGLGFTILHHLFDAGWSVPIRRVLEQIACSLRYMWLLWIPIGLLAPKLYEWIRLVDKGTPDLSTKAKFPLFTITGFYLVSIACLAIWW